jgi:LPS O-antigen subunit length determinant protein (WzzB/FepE family)
MKFYGIVAFFSLLAAVLIMALVYHQYTLLAFINSTASSALITFTFGCVLYVYSGGFFQGVSHSFKHFFKNLSKQGELLAESEEKEEYYQRKTFKSVFTYPLLLVGAVFFLFSLLLSYAV